MVDKMGLVAEMALDVSDKSIKDQKKELDREFEKLEVGVEIDEDALAEAQERAGPSTATKAKRKAKKRLGQTARRSGSMAKSAGKQMAHAGAARFLSSLGIPTTVPTTNLPGMGGGGGGGGGTAGLGGTTASESESVVEILNMQLATQEEILEELEEGGIGTRRQGKGGGGGILSGVPFIGGGDGGGVGILEALGLKKAWDIGKDKVGSLGGKIKDLFKGGKKFGFLRSMLLSGAMTPGSPMFFGKGSSPDMDRIKATQEDPSKAGPILRHVIPHLQNFGDAIGGTKEGNEAAKRLGIWDEKGSGIGELLTGLNDARRKFFDNVPGWVSTLNNTASDLTSWSPEWLDGTGSKASSEEALNEKKDQIMNEEAYTGFYGRDVNTGSKASSRTALMNKKDRLMGGGPGVAENPAKDHRRDEREEESRRAEREQEVTVELHLDPSNMEEFKSKFQSALDSMIQDTMADTNRRVTTQ
jgi:hypothetical protein